MKQTRKTRFLLCLLSAIMLLSPISLMSCKDNQGSGPNPPAGGSSFVLAGEGAENPYAVVRSDDAHSGSKISAGAAALRKAINERFGGVAITTDWTGAGGTPESDYEILVGPTNRSESEEVIKDLGVNEFIIRMVDYLVDNETGDISIAPKVAYRPRLSADALTMGSIMLVALPMTILAAALIILYPRRHL